jgi:acetylornithine/N-succinyldiaminopimelate aminotransferase
VNGTPKHRAPYQALLHESVQIPFDNLLAAENALKDDVAAVIIEPVQGEGGVRVPRRGYLTELRELCHANGSLLICDEVQTGIGRTGKLFASEHEDVRPDIVTLGKGLGGGFPVAAFLCTDEVAQTAQPGDHGTTYGGNPLACAAANAVLRVVEEEKLVDRAASLGEKLASRLAAFAEENADRVEGTRGKGLLQGLLLREPERAAKLPRRALEKGVVLNVTAGNVVRFFPALNIPEDELWEAVDRVFALIREG